jgi:MFS family permease
MFATLFYIPVFLQSALGMGALDAGLVVLPQALMMGVMAPLSGRLYDRIGPRWLVFSGLLIAAYATHLMTGLNLNTTKEQIILWTCIRSIGMGLGMMSVQASGIAALDPRLTNSGSAINNVVQRVSSALGLAALSAMVTMQQAQLLSDRNALIQASDPQAGHLSLVGLYQLYTGMNLEVLANAVTNMFQITTWITVLAAVLALTLRSGPAGGGGPSVAALD